LTGFWIGPQDYLLNIPEDANHRVVRTLLVEESRDEKYKNQHLKNQYKNLLIKIARTHIQVDFYIIVI
jgi:hypothetical protein